jgi:hypothetical protein
VNRPGCIQLGVGIQFRNCEYCIGFVGVSIGEEGAIYFALSFHPVCWCVLS